MSHVKQLVFAKMCCQLAWQAIDIDIDIDIGMDMGMGMDLYRYRYRYLCRYK